MAQTIKELANCGQNIILVIGSNHAESLRSKLEGEGINVSIDMNSEFNNPSFISRMIAKLVSNSEIATEPLSSFRGSAKPKQRLLDR